MPQHIPFKELKACPKCGRMELQKVHDQKYAGKEGIYRLVVYRCPNGHETSVRQLVVKQDIKDGDWWVS
jgi:lysyl-tRNA synthetase class I